MNPTEKALPIAMNLWLLLASNKLRDGFCDAMAEKFRSLQITWDRAALRPLVGIRLRHGAQKTAKAVQVFSRALAVVVSRQHTQAHPEHPCWAAKIASWVRVESLSLLWLAELVKPAANLSFHFCSIQGLDEASMKVLNCPETLPI